jgi:hypothetical protein
MEPGRREAQDPEIRRISYAGDGVNPARKGREGLGGEANRLSTGEVVGNAGGSRFGHLLLLDWPHFNCLSSAPKNVFSFGAYDGYLYF